MKSMLRFSTFCIALLLVLCGFPAHAGASDGANPPGVATTPVIAGEAPSPSVTSNLLVNGDLDTSNYAIGCFFNQANATINANLPGIVAYGAAGEIDLSKSQFMCLVGGLPHSGLTKFIIHRQPPQFNRIGDEFSFQLTNALVPGSTYVLTFFAWSLTDFGDPDAGPIEIGLSNNSTTFGTLIFSSTPGTTAWTEMVQGFVAPFAASYLTVRVGPNAQAFIQVDSFSLIEGSVAGAPTGPAAEFGARVTPNPSRGPMQFELRSPEGGAARLAIFDLAGRRVATVLDRELAPGVQRVDWLGRDDSGNAVASGVYRYRLTIGTLQTQGALIVTR
jgi:hypothetical protein